MKTPILFFFLFFVCVLSHAQSISALVEMTDGIQLTGKLKKVPVLKGFEQLVIEIDGDLKIIPLERLNTLYVNDTKYVRQRIRYESLETDILLASFLRGDVSLYEGVNLNGEQLFFIERTGEERRRIPVIGINNFLNYYFKDCPSWTPLTKSITYRKFPIASLAANNLTCFGNEDETVLMYDIQKNKAKLTIGGMIGWQNTKFAPIFDRSTIYVPEFTSVNSFIFGGLLKVSFSQKFSIQQELNYTFTKNTNEQYAQTDVYREPSNFSVALHALEFPTIINYHFNLKSIYPYIGVGLNQSLYFNQNFNYDGIYELDRPRFDNYSAGIIGTVGAFHDLRNGDRVGVTYRFMRSVSLLNVKQPALRNGVLTAGIGGFTYANMNADRQLIGVQYTRLLNSRRK
ncbi:MAG: outer membrane beta-barrel protein [Bacteroidota bacterium]